MSWYDWIVKTRAENKVYRRVTKQYPSAPIRGHDTSRKEKSIYTGTYVKGVATVHKSNYVPVTSAEQAKTVSRK